MKTTQTHLWTNPFAEPSPEARLRAAWASTPLLRGIPSGICDRLVQRTHVRQYQPGEYVFREGDNAVAAALVLEGTVVIRSSGVDGDIATLGAGDFFGEAALLEDIPRSASAVAQTPARISMLVRYQLEEFVRHRPRAGLDIMTNLARLLLARLQRGNRARSAG